MAKFQIQKPFSLWFVRMALVKAQKVVNAVKLIVKLELHSMFFLNPYCNYKLSLRWNKG